jgi:group I intron endonuclease
VDEDRDQSKRTVRCGIYGIQEIATGRLYVGSSIRIHQRWSEHRRQLRNGTHHSQLLQQAWTEFGSEAFRFVVLEECGRLELCQQEQAYINALEPQFNVDPIVSVRSEALYALLAERGRQRSKVVTHCPKGHHYDEVNTSINQGKRICRKCAAERTNAIYAKETPEQREARRQRVKESHQQHRDERLAKLAEYAAAHKEEKRAYDQSRAAIKAERDRQRRTVANLTPEQLEAQRQARRDHYHRDPERMKIQQHEKYIRRRDRLKEVAL